MSAIQFGLCIYAAGVIGATLGFLYGAMVNISRDTEPPRHYER